MSDDTGTCDDWLSNPAPPPRAIGAAAHKPAAPKKAPARPGAGKKPATPQSPAPQSPLDKLAAELDAAPMAADPQEPPGAGLDPPENAPQRPRGGDSGGPSGGDAPPPRGREKRPTGEIWKGCPVRPLGVNGGAAYYLDVHGQMRPIVKHDAQSIMSLFGKKIPSLCFAFPQFDKDGNRKPHRFDQTGAAMDMMAAASERGLFDPDGSVRGVGAWRDDDGQLIYHTGDRLILPEGETDPQTHHGRIYPAYPPIPHPAPPDLAADPVPELRALLSTWNWARPDIDPMICLGMIGIQMLGGALDWRPTFWLTGARAAGKSTFQKLIELLHGPKGMVQSSDATKSGITARLGHSSLPVGLDELEPGDEGSGKEKAIIDLARIASSGGQWFRGTADQKGASGNVYSAFMFSSILIPGALNAADLSRLIILSLNSFAEDAPAPPPLRAETWRKRGAALKRILMSRWSGWADRLDLWREALAKHRITGRNADNWATILAMADMAQSADMPTAAAMDGWARKVARWVAADLGELGTDADALVTRLLTQKFEPFKGREGYTVAQWLMVAAALPGAPPILGNEGANQKDPDALRDYARKANLKLATIGLRVIGEGPEAALFIANAKMQGLLDLFRGTEWAGGAWKQSAARVKGAYVNDVVRTLAGVSTRGVHVPFASMPGLISDQDRDARAQAAAAAPMPEGMEDFA